MRAKTKIGVFVVVIAVLAFAAYWSIRFAWADLVFRENTPASVGRAVSLDPANARYRAWQAEIDEHEGRDPGPALRAAIALNPQDSAVRIRLGLRQELEGDPRAAERTLLEAARIDRLLAPRFTLMNFYFRQGDRVRFREWTARTLAMGYGDMAAVFRLEWRAMGDAEGIRALMPQRAPVLAAYLEFLLGEGRLDAAGPITLDLARVASSQQTPLLLAACDRLIEARRGPTAIELWNALSRRGAVPYPPGALTNGDFALPPLGRGFDWRVPPGPEIAVSRLAPAGLLLSLSGKQPERVELLWQYLPLAAGASYRFRCSYRTGMTGLRWQAAGQSAFLAPTEDWREAEFTFAAVGPDMPRLALLYERQPGTARAEGSIELRTATLEPAP